MRLELATSEATSEATREAACYDNCKYDKGQNYCLIMERRRSSKLHDTQEEEIRVIEMFCMNGRMF